MRFNYCIHFLLFLFLTGWVVTSSSSPFISYDALESQRSTGRTLLQVKKRCAEDFDNKNYTIITSMCKGPQYPTDKCCNSLKEFACPFADSINDLQSDCAETMFSYINLYGKFPPGLFAHKCREGKQGLDCDSLPAPPAQNARAVATRCQSTLLMLAAGSLVFFLMMS